MKKIYCLMIVFLAISNALFAQIYHEDDKAGLRTFLRQTGKEKNGNAVKNYEKLGLTVHDTLNWQTSEAWISKVRGLTWNTDPFKKIKSINWSYKVLIGSLDCSLFERLITLYCSGNQLKSLDVTKNVDLTELYCSENQLSNLEVSKNINLTKLLCGVNQIGSLDVSNNANLESLSCSYNQLSSLDISKNVELKELSCDSNQLNSLDVLNNVNLTYLECNSNQISSLDVSNNVNLRELDCYLNQLSSLDVSNNVNLTYLICSSNQLSSLDVSNNVNLTELYCLFNQLSSLDVSNNVNLTYLSCSSNKLSSLNISKDLFLMELSCNSNYLKFSLLPKAFISYFDYSPQKKLEGGEITAGQLIDLSSEYVIDGNITTYAWYDSKGKPVNLSSAGNGKFMAPVEYIGDTLLCKMTNVRFPELTLEYEIFIKEQSLKAKALAIDSSVKIYPNPVTEILSVNTEEKINSLEVYNLMGIKLKKENNSRSINVQNLNKGMYILKVSTDKRVSTYNFRKD